MVEIVLPYSADGFYRFGDLPWLIANAQAPDDENLKDWIRCVWCWKDDGTAEGNFTRRLAPDGVLTDRLLDSDAWLSEPFDLSREPADRSRSNLFSMLWEMQRRTPEWHHYLSDGSLVIHHDDEPNSSLRAATRRLHMSNYEKALDEAVNARAIVVCNCSGLPHSFPHGQARLDGVVHIDELNRWGATFPGGQQFRMAGATSQPLEPVATAGVFAESQKPPATGVALPTLNPAPKDEADALRHCLTILAPLHTPDERKMMALNIEQRIAGNETALFAFRFRQLAALFYPSDREKAEALEAQMKAEAQSGELVSKIQSGQEGAFISDLAAWPNCPLIPCDSPLRYWLPHMVANDGLGSQASIPPPQDSIDRRPRFTSDEQQARVLKRNALVAELVHEWPTIDKDLREASRNGLSKAARTQRGWDVAGAKVWADSKGKLTKPTAHQNHLDAAWAGKTTRHNLGG